MNLRMQYSLKDAKNNRHIKGGPRKVVIGVLNFKVRLRQWNYIIDHKKYEDEQKFYII